jgi:hypothetical protein
VVGPVLAIEARRLDFGLVPLGETRVLTLTFRNLGKVPAQWALAPAPTPRSEEARAAAAAQAEGLPYVIERAAEAAGAVLEADGGGASDWAWGEEDVDPTAEGSIAQRLAARHAARGVELEMPCGVLAGGAAQEVRVTVRPAAAQSMRLSLALKCADGATRHITVRAEVVARKACLSLSEMPLGTTYVRVPVKKLIKLRNLTQVRSMSSTQ